MDETTTKEQLKGLISNLRAYGLRLIDGLSTDEFVWKPKGSKGRSIQSIFRHVVNTELFWLSTLNLLEEEPDYPPRESSLRELKMRYVELHEVFNNLVDRAGPDDLIPIVDPESRTLAWAIWRTSLHAVHHLAQISYLRFALDKPPDAASVDTSWGKVIDLIITHK
ncbi:MAG: DinB family protein [Candidatus Heimdallarchaeota archaeon]